MLFQATGISKAFGPTQALDDVGLDLRAGEVHAVVGENGSGKSTLMRILHGEISPDRGSMSIQGKPYAPNSPRQAMDRGMALVHQELAVCGHMSVWENVFLGAEKGTSISAQIDRTRELLGRLGHSDLDPNTEVRNLPPAVQQLVEIARAMRSEAQIILFDEPTSSLGRRDVDRLFDVIRELKQDRAIVYISHFLDEIEVISDRVTVLRDGKNANVSTGDGMPSSAQIIEWMTGRTAEQVYHRTQRQPGEAVLAAQDVWGRKLPRGVSLDLRKGEVLGIAGLNGAGRTEFVRCLFGLDRARGTMQGESLDAGQTPGKRWKQGFGFVSEDRKTEGLALNLSLAENLTMPVPRGKQLERTEAIIKRLRVKCRGPEQKISALSGGNQQKIAIGRLLDMDSNILLLDEPTRGIDIGSKGEIFRLIDELANQGKSVIFISSYLPELMGLCDRIAVMRRGEVVATLDARETNEHEVMQLCTGA
jgi:ribose transport system ATP-binding protein